MDFQDFPMILGNLGVETDHPPKMCAGLIRNAQAYARLEAHLHAHLVHDEQARDLPDALLHRDEASERRHVSGVNPLAKTGIARIIQQRRSFPSLSCPADVMDVM